jgi:hypothetical protein
VRDRQELLSEALCPCQSAGVSQDAQKDVTALRAVAPLIVTGPSPQYVGPCTLVTNGTNVVAFTSADLLRAAPEPLAIALTLDCKTTLPVTAWTMSRSPHMGLIDLGTSFPFEQQLDVEPLPIGAVCASVDTRGAPSALVVFTANGTAITRRTIAVHVDAIDGEGMSDDVIVRLASPDDAADATADIDGAPLFSWLPAEPVLGRPSEVVVEALACPYRAQTFKPRELAALAELHDLDDLGRALPWVGAGKPTSNELSQIAGEIRDVDSGPVAEPDREGD